jgi:MoaA/NifB/PqqE/SkfB family radical SAM enzyme
MDRVDIKIGYQCNNMCAFCVQGNKRATLPTKSLVVIEKNLREAFKKGNREVVITGGEPTVHPKFLEIVKLAKKIGFKNIQIQTNGRTFSNMLFCAKTIQAGATEFSPALHGPTAKIHDGLTCAPGSFKQVVQAIKNLKKLKQDIVTNTVITSRNYKHLPKLAELFVELGVGQFQFAFVHILGTADKNKKWLVPKKTDVMPYVKKALEIGLRAGKIVSTEAIPYCLMQGYENCIAEQFIPETRIYDVDTIDDYGKYRKDKGKIKFLKCKKCKYFKKCEGPWKEYVEIFGDEEFEPILK